jgi:hypothetical protein
MAHEMLQAMVGMAIVDPDFRRQLVERSGRALNEFRLSNDESTAVRSIEANSFQDFASQLHNWISRDAVLARVAV